MTLAHALLAQREVEKYWRFSRDLYSNYQDATTNAIGGIQGVILGVTKNTLRTDGVIVDTVLGGGDGLDPYSHGLQDEKVRKSKIENDVQELGIATVNAAVAANATTAPDAFAKVFSPPSAQQPKS